MKWEYVMMNRPASTFTDPSCHTDLNMLGMDRWELVGVYDKEVFIFKRPMEERVGTFKEPSTDWEPQMPVIDFTKRDDERAFSMWLLNDPHALGLEKLRSAYAAGLAEGRSRP